MTEAQRNLQQMALSHLISYHRYLLHNNTCPRLSTILSHTSLKMSWPMSLQRSGQAAGRVNMATNTYLVRETDTQRGTFFFFIKVQVQGTRFMYLSFYNTQNTSCGKTADISVLLVRRKLMIQRSMKSQRNCVLFALSLVVCNFKKWNEMKTC